MNLTREQINFYIIGSLNCSGVVYTVPDLNRALLLYREILSHGFYHLPFFLIVDLLVLLEKGFEVRFRSENKEAFGETSDRKLVMRYERECLGRILQSAEVQAAMEIAATSPHPRKVTGRLLYQITRSLAPHFPDKLQLNPGLLRDFQFPETIEPEKFETEELPPLIETFLGEINAHVNWGNLLFEEDIFELAHLETLRNDHLRVGCRQILELSRMLRSATPLQLDLTSHEDGADTAFLDETHYPTGGLAGLTNRGSFENLLTSELVYLDEGTKDVSLFELRYAEGELLFYLRDSGNLRRKRRSIHFILDAGDIFENKLPGYRWQYSVLLQGICLRLLHDLFELFEMDALRFHFHYIIPENAPPEVSEFFEGETGVMKTVLADYVKHEWVTFDTENQLDIEELIDPQRKSYAVIFAGPESGEQWHYVAQRVSDEELALHCAVISVHTDTDGDLQLPAAGLDVPELLELKNRTLEELVS